MIISEPPPSGNSLRDAAHRLSEHHRAWTVLRGRRALLRRLLIHGVATIDDVRGVIAVPPGVDPTCLGAVPRGLRDIIAADGYVVTGRAVAHARPVTRWRLVDADAAVEWLRAHPDPEQPPAVRDGLQYLLPLAGEDHR